MKILLLFFLGTTLLSQTCSRAGKPEGKVEDPAVQIAFYNVENLFDTINQPNKNDGEFTPDGKKAWNADRYRTKLDKIEQVLASIDSSGKLIAVGLAEVENLIVLQDLVRTGFLKERDFDIVHFESPDFRGIDVALIYDPQSISVLNARKIEVKLDDDKTTRDILRVSGELSSGDTAIFYVNHWPSRWGGTEKTKSKRIKAAQTLREDLVNSGAIEKKTLVMGDLNDYPDNESVVQVLGADSTDKGELINATWAIHKNPELGTHNYKGHWGCLDQIIVSSSLYPRIDTVYAFRKPFMLYNNKRGDQLPSRTYGGKNYYGGYSDHLPVVVKFK